ncbi:hypothetical protein K443DRAFT_450061 [Laccaria amethystina LaAM-08-1]|uniref:Uncharacterized protein n=1 Tax=Laccaria amethystina LaAM-08-1 TaxID=1095629 RepID=A0A0C9YFM6_9AGAR|nr:hypothetical protein K443DRAFT_450061 [Laccaria amethystina LaAM-08-1]
MGLTLIQHSTVLIFFPYWNLVVLPYWSFLNKKWENTLDYGRRGGLQSIDTSDTFHFACVVFVQSVSKYFVRFKQVCSIRFSQPPSTFYAFS